MLIAFFVVAWSQYPLRGCDSFCPVFDHVYVPEVCAQEEDMIVPLQEEVDAEVNMYLKSVPRKRI